MWSVEDTQFNPFALFSSWYQSKFQPNLCKHPNPPCPLNGNFLRPCFNSSGPLLPLLFPTTFQFKCQSFFWQTPNIQIRSQKPYSESQPLDHPEPETVLPEAYPCVAGSSLPHTTRVGTWGSSSSETLKIIFRSYPRSFQLQSWPFQGFSSCGYPCFHFFRAFCCTAARAGTRGSVRHRLTTETLEITFWSNPRSFQLQSLSFRGFSSCGYLSFHAFQGVFAASGCCPYCFQVPFMYSGYFLWFITMADNILSDISSSSSDHIADTSYIFLPMCT